MNKTKFISLSLLLTLSSLFISSCLRNDINNQNKKNSSDTMINFDKSYFGQINGEEIFLFTISNNHITVKITNFGGIVTSILVPGKNGTLEDVVLGFDELKDYEGIHPYFGCIVGRYANRISGAQFILDNHMYRLAANVGENHLHGGLEGFDKKIWDASEFREPDGSGVELSYTSPDGEEGYPGELTVRVKYKVTLLNELKIEYYATSTGPTPVNLTHHSYFNLKGAGNGDILDQLLMIDADRYNVVNEQLIPTGELRDVTGTPFDFRVLKPIGRDMTGVDGGYDHNFVLNNKGEFKRIAMLKDPASGRVMEVFTDQPGIQFYGGNFLDGSLTGKEGKKYFKHFGLCLETQHFPDSPNHPEFPNTILRPGEEFKSVTVYKFGIDNSK